MFTKLKLLFKGGGKIDLTPILKNVRDIEIEPLNNDGSSDNNNSNKTYFPYWSKPTGFIIAGDDVYNNLEFDDDGQMFINNIVVHSLEDLTPEFVKTNGTYYESKFSNKVVEAGYNLDILLLYEYAEYKDEYNLKYGSKIEPAVSSYKLHITVDVDTNGNVDENTINMFNIIQQGGSSETHSVIINGEKYLITMVLD